MIEKRNCDLIKLTQNELAQRINKKRTFISKVENDGENITLKTLYEIVELGLGGKLNISFDFYHKKK